MAKGNKNAGVFALVFIGSLLFLGVAFGALGSLTSGSWFGTLGQLGPLLWAIGVLSGVALFFTSLASLVWGWNEAMLTSVKNSMVLGAISLVAIAGMAVGWAMWASVLGFVLIWLGLGMAKMSQK
ncbi:MAG: hypothetical protein KGH61_01220 [Candidatus Micrarchaeota archaeon]|nr:hypothetical protein [Candidatus Micrarchaeota archaeon]MDE1847552.1 hypothetical protein [Candidatus Micrarchaeota archaeon]MDE1864269.1 hypothetical protein [Candidatus Micrarchaeota archaeon]